MNLQAPVNSAMAGGGGCGNPHSGGYGVEYSNGGGGCVGKSGTLNGGAGAYMNKFK